MNVARGMHAASLCIDVFYVDKRDSLTESDVPTEETTMPPLADVQSSGTRKRGRPPNTPTKGPAQKQTKSMTADCDAVVTKDVSIAQGDVARPNTGCCLKFYTLLFLTYSSRYLCNLHRIQRRRGRAQQGRMALGESATAARGGGGKALQRPSERDTHASTCRHDSAACSAFPQRASSAPVRSEQR